MNPPATTQPTAPLFINVHGKWECTPRYSTQHIWDAMGTPRDEQVLRQIDAVDLYRLGAVFQWLGHEINQPANENFCQLVADIMNDNETRLKREEIGFPIQRTTPYTRDDIRILANQLNPRQNKDRRRPAAWNLAVELVRNGVAALQLTDLSLVYGVGVVTGKHTGQAVDYGALNHEQYILNPDQQGQDGENTAVPGGQATTPQYTGPPGINGHELVAHGGRFFPPGVGFAERRTPRQ